MGRQNKDPATVGSSIVLLQERFKQLQRLKEMREERQILKLMPEEVFPATRFSTAYEDPLVLGLDSTSHHTAQIQHMNPQQFPAARRPHSSSQIHDVDTSLRL